MDIGMSARNVLLVNVDPAANGYSSARTRQFFETLATRLAAVPGVKTVTYTNLLPLSFCHCERLFVPATGERIPRQSPSMCKRS